MNASFRAPVMLAFILAAPLFARPALGAAAHETEHRPGHHRMSDFAAAAALIRPVVPAVQAPETDGLSRNAEECTGVAASITDGRSRMLETPPA